MEEHTPSIDFLRMINDYSVGSSFVTPGLRSYGTKAEPRVALTTYEQWCSYEGVHLNAAEKSQTSALASMGLGGTWIGEDRVLLMDFDTYDKDGTPKRVVVTPEDVLSRLRSDNLPLPFYWLESTTPGNFHMAWVFDVPMLREEVLPYLRPLYLEWGADPKFTNSTMRNPVFMQHHSPEKIHWWYEWSDVAPLLDSPDQLFPSGVPDMFNEAPKATPVPVKIGESLHTVRKKDLPTRLSMKQIEDILSGDMVGVNVWHVLGAWFRRTLLERFRYEGTSMDARTVRRILVTKNQELVKPLSNRRLEYMIQYWTRTNQIIYCRRQISAGRSNWQARESHDVAERRFQWLMYWRGQIVKYLVGDVSSIPGDWAERSDEYSGRKMSVAGAPCYEYLAYVMGTDFSPCVDFATGEVSSVSVAQTIKNIIGNGRRKGYEELTGPPQWDMLGAYPTERGNHGEDNPSTTAPTTGERSTQINPSPLLCGGRASQSYSRSYTPDRHLRDSDHRRLRSSVTEPAKYGGHAMDEATERPPPRVGLP